MFGLDPASIRDAADALSKHMQQTAANTDAIAQRLAAIDQRAAAADQALRMILGQMSDLSASLAALRNVVETIRMESVDE